MVLVVMCMAIDQDGGRQLHAEDSIPTYITVRKPNGINEGVGCATGDRGLCQVSVPSYTIKKVHAVSQGCWR